jgi:adenine deaminase
MSPLPVPDIARQVTQFEHSLPELGLPPFFPIHLLAMALPVIPVVRLTDLGMVDIITQQFVPMQA